MAAFAVSNGGLDGRDLRIYGSCSGAQTSTNDNPTVVTDSAMDIRSFTYAGYNVVVTTNTMKISVYGGNASDFSDEGLITTAVANAAGVWRWVGGNSMLADSASHAPQPLPYGYVRMKFQTNAGGANGTITWTGMAKNS